MTETIVPSQALAFREAMSLLASAVTIVTTDGPNGRHGFTVSAVSSVSDSPPTLLVCVNRNASSHPHLLAHGKLAVNVLSSAHDALSGVFASSKFDMETRFASGRWTVGETGLPILEDALATLECRVTETADVGSHTVIFAEVEQIVVPGHDARGLVWFRRGYVSV
ncbi:flavin reductase family protein [Tanticharoenia sakaeratensis]|uniref:Flavin mononucleotide (FMN) reductase n=1 Tax=Tanticharoenia sakaeratensis NBRC 103193 TaxID=1231623 RepID=A0A0D6MKY6_9PROT|nr:flavin reductase family protein [Tanticharoenia sakaeratensis]GAN54319.1 flavin mononucleotide (FMN) reductase [Tanticharoenia sakaeratensis NBRC 103193]GBQ18960.1 flavin mononucleotide reductase [Tanticharoenia sakaeratensis NBRC 103193]